MHYLIKQFVPPILKTLRWYSFKYGWKGDYSSYAEARSKATGYDANHILERVIYTTKRVREGIVPYERDGIEYDQVKLNYPLLSTLLWIASQNDNKLCVLDFGGSLGTTYFQNLPFLNHLKSLTWCIVEQENYIEAGKAQFETDQLRFYYSFEECLKEQKPDLLLINSTPQYLEEPYSFLESFHQYQIPYTLFDYIGFNDEPRDRLAIQHVPPVFYGKDASYPCWFFNKEKMLSTIAKHHEKCFEFVSEPDTYYLELKPFQYQGQLWKLKQ